MVSFTDGRDRKVWWMRYRDRDGERASRESTNTEDWQEAQRKLRERLQARDDNILQIRPQGRATTFSRMGGVFLGELLQAADSSGEDPRGQRACRQAPQGRCSGSRSWRDLTADDDRRLSCGSGCSSGFECRTDGGSR